VLNEGRKGLGLLGIIMLGEEAHKVVDPKKHFVTGHSTTMRRRPTHCRHTAAAAGSACTLQDPSGHPLSQPTTNFQGNKTSIAAPRGRSYSLQEPCRTLMISSLVMVDWNASKPREKLYAS
jgi:hypothetical protein